MTASPATDPALLARMLASEVPAEICEALVALESGGFRLDEAQVSRLLDLLAHAGKEIRRRAAGALAAAVGGGTLAAEAVAAALGDGNAERRFGAAFALSRAGIVQPKAIEVALDALGHGDGDVRWAAAEMVCACARADPAVRERLPVLARDAQPERRKMALYCLRDLGQKQPDVFMLALDDSDPNVRMAGLAGLGRAGGAGSEVVDRLIALARGDEVPGVRRAAVGVLGIVGLASAPAIEALQEFAGDCDPHAARAARSALARSAASQDPKT